MRHRQLATLCACLFLAACGGDKTAAGQAKPGEEGLPRPDAAGGSVTGMPNPGMSSTQPAPMAGIPDMRGQNGVDGAVLVDPAPPMDPLPLVPGDVDAAVLVLRGYYAAINARDYANAYAQWSDGGRASGQSMQQFVDGFADTAGVSVAFGEAGPIEGAAGARYIEIPVTADATQTDGSVRHYTGGFTMRMSVVDGASAAQRNWHIVSASLRELRP